MRACSNVWFSKDPHPILMVPLAVSEDLLNGCNWVCVQLASSRCRTGVLLNILRGTGQSPHPKVSIVLRVKTPDLKGEAGVRQGRGRREENSCEQPWKGNPFLQAPLAGVTHRVVREIELTIKTCAIVTYKNNKNLLR